MREEVDLIVKAKYIVTLGPKGNLLKGAIAIKNGHIIDVDSEDRILSKYRAEEIHEYPEHIITPGFVDCHVHTQQLLLRSSISDEDLELPPIWTRYLIPFENMMSEYEAYISSLMSLITMLKSGVTTFVEAGAPHPEQLVKAVRETGARGFVSVSTYNVMEDLVVESSRILEHTLQVMKMCSDDMCRTLFSIRQLMMITEDLIDKIRKLLSEHRTGLTMHLAEYQCEVDFCLDKYGKRPLEFVDSKGLTNVKPFIAAHAVFLSEKEIEIAISKRLGICWCPTVDSYLMGNHWLSIYGSKALFGIGSDGGAFTNLDLLHEVKIARALSKSLLAALTYTKSSMKSELLLRALTGQGGELLGIRIGRVDKKYMADLVVLRIDKLHLVPVYDPVEAIINFLERDSIQHVYVRGKKVVEDRELKTLDEQKIYEKFLDLAPNVENLIRELKRAIKTKPWKISQI